MDDEIRFHLYISYLISSVPEFKRSDPHKIEHSRFLLGGLSFRGSILGGLFFLSVYYIIVFRIYITEVRGVTSY